jgi:hypothetical protein
MEQPVGPSREKKMENRKFRTGQRTAQPDLPVFRFLFPVFGFSFF